jgi:hypothetical protein
VGSWAECVARTIGGSTADPQVGLGASNGALTGANCSGRDGCWPSGLTANDSASEESGEQHV